VIWIAAFLTGLSLLVAQYFVGGIFRPVLPMPAYLVLGLAAFFSTGAFFRHRSPRVSMTCVVAACTLVVWIIAPLVIPPSDDWLSGAILRTVLACLTIYCLMAFVIVEPRHRLVFLSVLLVGSFVQASFGIYQYANGDSGLPVSWFSEMLRVWYDRKSFRAHGFYANANHLAWLLNVAIFFGLSIGVWGRVSLWLRLLVLYATGVFFVAAVLCQSRGGVWATGVGLLLFLILSFRATAFGAWGRRGHALMLGIAAIGIAVGGGWVAYSNSLLAQERFKMISDDFYRTSVWPIAVRQWQLEPLLGTGPGTFANLARTYRDFRSDRDEIFVHNDWLQTLAELGSLGVLLGILVCGVHFREGWRCVGLALTERMAVSSRPFSLTVALQIGALCSLAASAVHSFFDFNLQLPANALLMATVLGILAADGVGSFHKLVRDRFKNVFLVLLVCASGGALSILTIRAATAEVAWIIAENALLAKDPALCLEKAGEGIVEAPNHARLHSLFGQAALTIAKQKLEEAPGSSDDLLWQAVGSFERAVQLEPLQAWNHIFLGHAYDYLRLDDRAEFHHLRAIEMAPSYATPREYYGLHLEMAGKTREAIAAYVLAQTFPGATFAGERRRALEK